MDTAERPFDPPLTATGVTQGAALGRRLRDFSPPITKVFVSPLVRTVQTADAAAAELGVSSLFIEPGLVEVLDTEWYGCWQCKPSDARGDVPAATLFLSPAQLREAVERMPLVAGTRGAGLLIGIALTQPVAAEVCVG